MPITGSGVTGPIDHGGLTGLGDDDHTQYLLLAGRTGGQVIGSGAHTGGGTTDIALEGRLLLGDNLTGVNYTTGRVLDVRQLTRNATTQMNIQYAASGFTGAASGIWRGLQFAVSGTAGYTSGSFTAQAMFMTATITLPAGVTGTEILGGLFQATPQETNSGTQGWNIVTGFRMVALGPSTANTGHTGTKLTAMNLEVGNRSKTYDDVYWLELSTNSSTAAVTNTYAIGNTGTWNSINTTNFYVLYFAPATLGGTNKYGLWLNETLTKGSVLGHKLRVGNTTDPAHWIDIAAGTTGIAPIRFASGGPLTAPAAGCLEYDGVDLLITDDTGDRNRIAPRLLATTTGINAKTVAQTTIYTVPTGRKLIVTGVVVRTTAEIALSVNGAFSVGSNAVSYDDIVASNTPAFIGVDQAHVCTLKQPSPVAAAGTAIKIDIESAATATTLTYAVDLIGYLIT